MHIVALVSIGEMYIMGTGDRKLLSWERKESRSV
jgi:hypothetical protein